MIVIGKAKSMKKTIEFLDPQTAQIKEVEVSWQSALEISPVF